MRKTSAKKSNNQEKVHVKPNVNLSFDEALKALSKVKPEEAKPKEKK